VPALEPAHHDPPGLLGVAGAQRDERLVERRLGMARPVVEDQLELHQQEQPDEHGEPPPVGRRDVPDGGGDRDRQADVDHDSPAPPGHHLLDEAGDHVAAVEGEQRQEVEQPDRRPGPPDRLRRRRPLPARLVQRIHPHQGEDGQPGGDVHDRAGESDEGLGALGQRSPGDVRRVSGHEVERDLGVRPRPPRRDGMAELVQQCEAGDRPGEPPAELVGVEEDE
jgi:hypothetical protein